MWCHTSENLSSCPFRQLLTSGASSQLSGCRLSWSYSDIQYNLKSFLELSLSAHHISCQAEKLAMLNREAIIIIKKKKTANAGPYLSHPIFPSHKRVHGDWTFHRGPLKSENAIYHIPASPFPIQILKWFPIQQY